MHHNFKMIIAMVFCAFIFLPAGKAFPAEDVKRLNLEESLQLALKNSLALHAVHEGVREAEARKNEAFGGFLPRLSTSYSFTRLNSPPSFNFPGFPPIPPSTVITGTEDNYNWALELRQPLFAGGGIRAGYDISRIGEDIARSAVKTVQLDVVKDVKTAYFRILKADRILEVARQAVEGLQNHRNQAQILYENGFIPRNDLLFAAVELANGRQQLLRAQNALELAKSELNILLRREINASLEVEDILEYRPFEPSWEDCLKAALTDRPEIRASDLHVNQTRQAINQARSEYFPSVNFVGNYSKYGDEPHVSGSAYKNQESWYLTVVANWNIWEGGRSQNRIDAGISREKQAVDASLNIRDRIILELKGAYLGVRAAEQQIPAAKVAVVQAEENYRITAERYKEQVARTVDVIDAQTVLTRARSDYYNALGDYNIGLAVLERAVGKAPEKQ